MTMIPDQETPSARAAGAIRAAILNAQFAPGQRLVESELVKILGVGRGPVREALRLLSAEGLVAIERNRGAVVARASKAMMAEVFETRERLEGLAARRAAERAKTSAHRILLEQALDEEAARDTDGDAQSLMEANERLHRQICDAAESEVLERLLGQLQLPELRSIFFRVMSPIIWRASSQEHIRVLQAILAGDEDTAEARMREHVQRTAKLVADLPPSVFS